MTDANAQKAVSDIYTRLTEGRVLVFVGAGVSIDAGMPTSEELAFAICDKAKTDRVKILDQASEAFLKTRGKPELDAFVSEFLA